jgi:hypothetical protein
MQTMGQMVIQYQQKNVAGGNFFGDLLDEVENVVEDVWDGVKDVTNEAVEVTWKGMKLVYDTVNPIQ